MVVGKLLEEMAVVCRLPRPFIPGNVQGQAGQGFELPDLAEDL